jgi:hypothetical protein
VLHNKDWKMVVAPGIKIPSVCQATALHNDSEVLTQTRLKILLQMLSHNVCNQLVSELASY